MKKNLALKLISITSAVLVMSLIIFLIAITPIFKKKYLEINNAKLIQFVTQASVSNGNPENAGYNYIYGSTNSNEYKTSASITNLVSSSEINKIISDFNKSSYKVSPVFKTYNGNKIYACGYAKGNNYIIAISDDSYIKSQTRSLVIVTTLIFLAIIILADALIYLYCRRIIKRIDKIKNEIIELPNNDYLKKIEGYGNDEIGQLAFGVEDLRKSILSANEKRNEMFQNLSHDLKTPISVIQSYAEAIKDGIVDLSSIEIINQQASILNKKANKLLELNKISYYNKDDFKEINMKDLIINVVKKYKFDFTLELKDVYFKGIYEGYENVLENLIDNSLRYKNKEVKISLNENELIIFNDGKPIDEEIIDDIFDPYVKGNDGNFGVGLSIVKKTLNKFSYEIKAQNLLNGVAFIIKNIS